MLLMCGCVYAGVEEEKEAQGSMTGMTLSGITDHGATGPIGHGQ